MINSSEFALRLKNIMEYYQLSASSFADKIKVPRSSISHLLSGRNKPSLDFVLKVIKEFSEVELYWLLNGKGNFPNENNSPPKPILIPKEFSNENKEKFSNLLKSNSNKSKIIEKIVMFYTDGTFKEYIN